MQIWYSCHGQFLLAPIAKNISLVLEEFYQNLRPVGVSAAVGLGMDAFLGGRS